MGRRSGVWLLVLSALASGCGDPGPTGLALGGSGGVTVTVSPGVTPTISWSGQNAARLSVTQSNGGGVFWDIAALSAQDGFGDPITFGVVPNTAREVTSSTLLTQGGSYSVHLTLVDGTSGTRVFSP